MGNGGLKVVHESQLFVRINDLINISECLLVNFLNYCENLKGVVDLENEGKVW